MKACSRPLTRWPRIPMTNSTGWNSLCHIHTPYTQYPLFELVSCRPTTKKGIGIPVGHDQPFLSRVQFGRLQVPKVPKICVLALPAGRGPGAGRPGSLSDSIRAKAAQARRSAGRVRVEFLGTRQMYPLFLGYHVRPLQKRGIYHGKPGFPKNALEKMGIWSRG